MVVGMIETPAVVNETVVVIINPIAALQVVTDAFLVAAAATRSSTRVQPPITL